MPTGELSRTRAGGRDLGKRRFLFMLDLDVLLLLLSVESFTGVGLAVSGWGVRIASSCVVFTLMLVSGQSASVL